jgi:hypothetical protein
MPDTTQLSPAELIAACKRGDTQFIRSISEEAVMQLYASEPAAQMEIMAILRGKAEESLQSRRCALSFLLRGVRLALPDWAEPDFCAPLLVSHGHAKSAVHRLTGIRMALVSASDGAFYIGRMEVTTTEWRRIMNFGEPTGRRTTPNHPAVSVSLEEILEFLHRTSLRLPTEAEWQNSWRHARRSAPPHPLELVSGNLGNWGRGVPSAGGISEPSAYPVFDLVGNVWEWVRTHSGHGIIGGGFGSGQEDLIDLQVARDWDPEDARVDLGFRVAADP